jgi:hypothetical protein
MKRLSSLGLAAALAVMLALPGAALAAKPAQSAALADIPVSGTLENGTAFTGTISIDEITRSGSNLVFSGTVENAAGALVGTFEAVAGTLSHGGSPLRCDILFLDLGPIFLDVLGLEVDLSRIVLDIDAVAGPGNLLGNLLCAVVGLLDGGLLGGGLLDLLDRILDRINAILN